MEKNVDKEIKKVKLSDYYGILSKKAGDALERNILEERRLQRKLYAKRIKRLMKMFSEG